MSEELRSRRLWKFGRQNFPFPTAGGRPLAGGWGARRGGGGSRRPSAAGVCTIPGHACPFSVLRVVDRVSRCARAAGQVCRPDFLRARPAGPAGRLVRGRSCTSPDGRRRPLCSCCAALCGVVRRCAQPCTAGACRPYGPTRRLWPYHGRPKSMGMLAPAMRPRPHSVADRSRARAPAGQRPSSHACTWSTRYPWKSAA